MQNPKEAAVGVNVDRFFLQTHKLTNMSLPPPKTEAKYCVENAMYFTRLSNQNLFDAECAMRELEKIVKSNLGRRISREAGLPMHWYEEPSSSFWTGYLGLWTRHFENLA